MTFYTLFWDFMRGKISYRDFFRRYLSKHGSCLHLRHTRAVLARVGVRPGALVLSCVAPSGSTRLSDQFIKLPCIEEIRVRYKKRYSETCAGPRVFYVRHVCVSPLFNTPAILIEDSFPLSVREAACNGKCYSGYLLKAGVFHFFQPSLFLVLGYANDEVVRLSLALGSYESLIHTFLERRRSAQF